MSSTFTIPPSRLQQQQQAHQHAERPPRPPGHIAQCFQAAWARCCGLTTTRPTGSDQVVTTSVDAVFVKCPAVGGRLVAERDFDAVQKSRVTSRGFVGFFLIMEALALWVIFMRVTSYCNPLNTVLLEDQTPSLDLFNSMPWILQIYFVGCILVANVTYAALYFPRGPLHDPGYLDVHGGDQLHPSEIGLPIDLMPLCHTCGHHRPLRSRHCRSCGRCVAKNDHHCFWLGTCVGPRNYLAFVVLVGSMALASMLGSLLVSHSVATSGMNDELLGCESNSEWGVWLWHNAAVLVTLCAGLYTTFFTGCLFFAHLFLAASNTTTFEFVRPERNPYLTQPSGKQTMLSRYYAKSPFDKGFMLNVIDAWCNPQAVRAVFGLFAPVFAKCGLRKWLAYSLLHNVSHDDDDAGGTDRHRRPYAGDGINYDLNSSPASSRPLPLTSI